MSRVLTFMYGPLRNLGDPDIVESRFSNYVEETAHQSVFVTGQGASAVGLRASLRKDPVTREWALEGGALVSANKGHYLIDEFVKKNDADRPSTHEVMEQQTISISKAGIFTTPRLAVPSSVNPLYPSCTRCGIPNSDSKKKKKSVNPLQQNLEREPIISSFDVEDTPDPVQDELLARFVVSSHLQDHP